MLFGSRRTHPARRRSQRGQAMMMMLVGFFGLATALLVYAMTDTTSLALRRDRDTVATMAEVKRALIGWSAQRTTSGTLPNARPGELPCPDMDNDGLEDGSCVAGAIGRVPWKTLGIPEPKDNAGETFWYVIAGPFRIWSMNGTVINSDTKGNITVYQDSTAATITTQAVAVIFAPGAALGSQNRSSATTALCSTTGTTIARNLCASNYLETASGVNNATTNGPFISAQTSATFNDKVMVITTLDLIPPVEQRVARELRQILMDYKSRTACACTNLGGTSGCYPWADLSNGYSDSDPYNAGEGRNRGRIPAYGAGPYDWGSNPCGTALPAMPSWFVNNDWRLVVYYAAGRNYLGPDSCTTCVSSTLTVDGSSGKQVVILMSGPNLGASPRSPVPTDDLTYWSYYFEDAENEDNGNDVFVTPTSTAYARDRIYTIP
jgi:hypothetical protein